MKQKSVAATVKADPKPGLNRMATPYKNDPLKIKELLETLSTHKPTTNIIARIKAAIPVMGMLEVTMTKALAMDIFTLNNHLNRTIRFSRVRKYYNMMKAGKWYITGIPIIMNWDCVDDDGQHRLLAWILADFEQPKCFIFCGTDPNAIRVYDTNLGRTAEDALRVMGVGSHAWAIATAIKGIIRFKASSTVVAYNKSQDISNQEVGDWAEKHTKYLEKLVEFVNVAAKELHPEKDFLSLSHWTFVYFTLWQPSKNNDDATDFVTRLAHGGDISEINNSAIFWLRKKLQKIDNDTKPETPQAATYVYSWKVRLIIKAWNQWKGGKRTTKESLELSQKEMEGPIQKPL